MSVTTYTGWHFTARRDQDRNGTPLRKHERLDKGTKLELCAVGLHASERALDALDFAPGPWVRRAELRGKILVAGDKACGLERVTLAGPVDVSRELRIYACDCGERVLPLFEAEHPGDDRPRRAIEVARRFVEGKATMAEMQAAWGPARDAAWAAARDAGGAAARDAAWAGGAAAEAAAEDAAWAARAAARDAAEAAAEDAAWAAEREWQDARLTEVLSKALGVEE